MKSVRGYWWDLLGIVTVFVILYLYKCEYPDGQHYIEMVKLAQNQASQPCWKQYGIVNGSLLLN